MCGIAGMVDFGGLGASAPAILEDMIGAVRHRGPDGFGFYRDALAGLAHARLSIIDLEGGWQPIRDEAGEAWIVFNGEIFNYLELREELEARGHLFYTRSDTEVVIHLWQDLGEGCLERLNGQFSFAVWDKRRERLFLARDRVGIRPLFYARTGGIFRFASEIKSLFMDPAVPRRLDRRGLDQIFTFWSSVPPRTAFEGIEELPAGHWMSLERGGQKSARWWDPDFDPATAPRTEEAYAEELRALLLDATRLQLRADVPVGAYLSGGLDSAVVATLIGRCGDAPVRTFSVGFHDEVYDESAYQREVVGHLGTDHSLIRCGYDDIGRVFPEVVRHVEKPILRTAPAPLFLLSALVRESGYKVVLTGEGSDEILAGYDIFKEAKVRRFIERSPGSKWRPLILKRLYPYLENSPARSVPYAEAFFGAGEDGYPPAFHAHVPRWKTTARAKFFYSDQLKEELKGADPVGDLAPMMDGRLASWDPLSQAQYLEIKTLLSGYLLSSQGDRVAMAHSVEGRFPFLDHRVMEFCFKLPPNVRMKALKEKYLLKKSFGGLLPAVVAERPKQPYMAPDARSFFRGRRLDYVEDLLSAQSLGKAGYFNPSAVGMLARKCRESRVVGFKDNMALVGILSTMILHRAFVEDFRPGSDHARRGIEKETQRVFEG